MNDMELRLECAKLATDVCKETGANLIDVAIAIHAFVTEPQIHSEVARKVALDMVKNISERAPRAV